MCGIAGLIGRSPVGEELRNHPIHRMLETITHRGPDESRAACLGRAVFGTVRLALVDKPTSSQPMLDERRRFMLSFNGEIYNHADLRKDLERAGVRFRTSGDTEVVLYSLINWGVEALSRFRGQFAVAFWDMEREELLLARDRTGIVPLYWTTRDDGSTFFASEVKVLHGAELSTPLSVPDVIDAGVLWGLHPGRSVFDGIESVPPGSFVSITPNNLKRGSYWQFAFAADRDSRPLQEQAADLAGLLAVAVRRRVPAYGDPAVLVSGGLDSTAVVALLRQLLPDNRIDSYSVQFTNRALNESPYQAIVAEQFRTHHASVLCNDTTIAEELVRTIEHTEVPLVRTAPASSMRLARRLEESGTRAVLSGEGADEFFCGYDLFKVAAIRDEWSKDPSSSLWPEMLKIVMAQQQELGHSVERAFFEHGLDQRSDPVFSHMNRWAASFKITRYLAPDIRQRISLESVYDGVRRRLPPAYHQWSAVEQAQYLEVKYFLATALLGSQCDRPYMSHSIEARYPFLDEDVIDFSLKLPERSKLDGTNEKAVIKLAVGDQIPKVISERTKQPYTAPEGDVFRSPAGRDLLDHYLSDEAIDQLCLFDGRRVRWLRDKLQRGPTSFHDDLAILWILSTQVLGIRYGVANV